MFPRRVLWALPALPASVKEPLGTQGLMCSSAQLPWHLVLAVEKGNQGGETWGASHRGPGSHVTDTFLAPVPHTDLRTLGGGPVPEFTGGEAGKLGLSVRLPGFCRGPFLSYSG